VRGQQCVHPAGPLGGVQRAVRVGLALKPGPQTAAGRLGRRASINGASPPFGRRDTSYHRAVPALAGVVSLRSLASISGHARASAGLGDRHSGGKPHPEKASMSLDH
jgi:hypothetical protein